MTHPARAPQAPVGRRKAGQGHGPDPELAAEWDDAVARWRAISGKLRRRSLWKTASSLEAIINMVPAAKDLEGVGR